MDFNLRNKFFVYFLNARERRLEGALMHDVLTVRGSRKGRSGGTEMDWSELPEELMAKLLEVL